MWRTIVLFAVTLAIAFNMGTWLVIDGIGWRWLRNSDGVACRAAVQMDGTTVLGVVGCGMTFRDVRFLTKSWSLTSRRLFGPAWQVIGELTSLELEEDIWARIGTTVTVLCKVHAKGKFPVRIFRAENTLTQQRQFKGCLEINTVGA